jgi:hypothetical protein
MNVHRPRLKTQGAVVTTVATLALAACDDPTARTDLRPEGPPEVLAVLVLNDALGGLVESAAFCKTGDEKRPGLVGLPDFTTTQICPEALGEVPGPLADAAPTSWYVRVMFDELLDPTVEDLTEVVTGGEATGVFTGSIARTKPVKLECQNAAGTFVDIPYDGYYSPSGNAVTWPLGPSIVIKPNAPATVATNSECKVTLFDVPKDKDGEGVPMAQRGPYSFKIAPVQIISISPGDEEKIAPEAGGVDLLFNTSVDAGSLCSTGTLPCVPGGTPKGVFTPAVTGSDISRAAANNLVVTADLLDDKDYAFEIPNATQVKDRCGKVTTLGAPSIKSNTKVSFKTEPFELLTVSPFGGENIAPIRKVKIDFNQYIEPSSFTLGTDYTLTPEPLGLVAGSDYNGDPSVLTLRGIYNLNTEYTFKILPTATIRDFFDTKNVAIPSAGIEVKFKTAPAIAVTGSSPASGGVVTKTTATSTISVLLLFNQEMDVATFSTGVDYTLVADADPTKTVINSVAVARIGSAPQAAEIVFPTQPAGSYTFTLKAGAALSDTFVPANVYTQAADRVIRFTVRDPLPPAAPCL